jgi:hypothetical protein
MRANGLLLLAVLPVSVAHAAEVCDPMQLVGPYAFQLSGTTTISGTPKPTASLGQIVLDGNGNMSGTASAMFSGFLLGNPVTGTYESNWDCSMAWKLQDDSGAFQHFTGTFSPDGSRVQFQQSDPGGAQQGIMEKTPGTCSAANLQKAYSYTVSGSTTPMQEGEVARNVSAKGTVDVAANGSFQVQGDCSVLFRLTSPSQNGADTAVPMNMRGFLVNGGKEILAFQTDPGAMVAARLRVVTK